MAKAKVATAERGVVKHPAGDYLLMPSSGHCSTRHHEGCKHVYVHDMGVHRITVCGCDCHAAVDLNEAIMRAHEKAAEIRVIVDIPAIEGLKQRKSTNEDGTPKVKTPRTTKGNGPACKCGCGDKTAGGNYLPGHDSRHLAALVDQVRNGGLGDRAELRAQLPSDALRAKFDKRVS